MKYLRIIAMALICMGLFSCEERHIDDNLYDSSVCIINNGLQKETLYDVEGEHIFTINTYCSGFYGGNPNVRLVYNQAGVLDTYNEENGTSYRLLPENCYQLDTRHKVMEDNKVSYTITFDCQKIAALTADKTYSDIQDYVIPYSIVSETDGINNPVSTGAGTIFIKPEMNRVAYVLDGPKSSELKLEGDWYFMPFKLSTSIENKWDIKHNFDMEFTDQNDKEVSTEKYSITRTSAAETFNKGVSEIAYEVKIHKSLLVDATTWVNIKASAGTLDEKSKVVYEDVSNWRFEVYSLWDKSGVTEADVEGSSPGDSDITTPICAFDGDVNTYWKNQGIVEPSPWLLQLNLNKELTIHALGIVGRQDMSNRPGACRTGGFRFDNTVTDIEVPAEQCAGNGQWNWHLNLDYVKGLFDIFYNYDHAMVVEGKDAPSNGDLQHAEYLETQWIELDEDVTTSVLQWWIISESSWDRPVATINGSGGNRFSQAAELEIMVKAPGVSRVD